jgi:predicted small secreted protein
MTRTLALLALVLALAACNTMRGVGQDMSAAGNAVSDTATDVQRKL